MFGCTAALSIVIERGPNLANASLQSMLEIDRGVAAPDLFPVAPPRDQLPGLGRENRQDTEGLRA
jgi:hypothetical protein